MAGRFGRRGIIGPETDALTLDAPSEEGQAHTQCDGIHAEAKAEYSDDDGLDDISCAGDGGAGSGCLACNHDNDHANLILCDRCNEGYHTYCLDPPLRSVPTGDWFCDNCRPMYESYDDDGLDRLVCALPPSFTSRFGEIVWAAGGVGFGWWPACIYDPRLTVGGARELARKNLGKKHLVYFFECHDAPFAVMVESRLTPWDDGLAEDFHLGKAARASGKTRSSQFEHALQAAVIEHAKPVEMRLEWNHSELPQVIPSPKRKRKRKSKSRGTEKRKNNKDIEIEGDPSRKTVRRKRTEKASLHSTLARVTPNRRNFDSAIARFKASNEANEIESSEDGELYLKILKKKPQVVAGQSSDEVESIGFVSVESRLSSTFADARAAIVQDFDPDSMPPWLRWKFYIPNLGPMSSKQETSVGPIREFLRSTTSNPGLGDGSSRHPIKVFIMETTLPRASLDSVATPTSPSSPNNTLPRPTESPSAAAPSTGSYEMEKLTEG